VAGGGSGSHANGLGRVEHAFPNQSHTDDVVALSYLMISLLPDEKAKLCVAMAYTVHSLYYMYLKAKVRERRDR